MMIPTEYIDYMEMLQMGWRNSTSEEVMMISGDLVKGDMIQSIFRPRHWFLMYASTNNLCGTPKSIDGIVLE